MKYETTAASCCVLWLLLLVSTQAALAENYWEYAHWSSSSSFHAEAVNAELCETLGATVFFRQFFGIITATILQRVLFEHPKGLCIRTPYHPFTTPWKIQASIYFCFHFTDELRITYESFGVLNPAASCRVFTFLIQTDSLWLVTSITEVASEGLFGRAGSRRAQRRRQWEVIGVSRGCSVVLTSWVFF